MWPTCPHTWLNTTRNSLWFFSLPLYLSPMSRCEQFYLQNIPDTHLSASQATSISSDNCQGLLIGLCPCSLPQLTFSTTASIHLHGITLLPCFISPDSGSLHLKLTKPRVGAQCLHHLCSSYSSLLMGQACSHLGNSAQRPLSMVFAWPASS